MASAFLFLFMRLCERKKEPRILTYAPFALVIVFPVILLFLYISGTEIHSLRNKMQTLESLAWMIASIIIIYTAYMLGTRAAGKFTMVYMFFQFGAYSAFIWKLLGFIENMGSPIPYSIREIVETLFGLFSIISMYVLAKMLRKLSKHMHSE